MELLRRFGVAFILILLSTEFRAAKIINGETCSAICECRYEENSSKVQVAMCSVKSHDTILQCSVEWPVLYLNIEMYQFDSNLLIRCQRIKRLQILSKSLLNVLKSDMFQYGSNLEILVIKAPIQTLDSALLRHLSSLQQLDISETKVDTISHTIFEECPIKDLRLASNKIIVLDDSSFKKCIYLLTLDLSRNLLRKINSSTFMGAFNLKELDLSKNQIEIIEDMSFKHLKKLNKLSLKDNLLQSIKPDTFRSLESLTHLRLQNNRIVYIAIEAFNDLKAIQVINLKDNKISRLDLIIFLHLTHLKIIFPDVNCVQVREEDSRGVSAEVLSEFMKYPSCDGKKKDLNVNQGQKLIQGGVTTSKPKENDPVSLNIHAYTYLVPMVLGALTVTLISIIVISMICHVKNKRIHELQLQEVQTPMMQSTL